MKKLENYSDMELLEQKIKSMEISFKHQINVSLITDELIKRKAEKVSDKEDSE